MVRRTRFALPLASVMVLLGVVPAGAQSGTHAEAPPQTGGEARIAAQWRLRDPDRSPAPTERTAMTFDSGRGEMVKFGGTPQDLESSDETWMWNGRTWKQLLTRPRPPGRMQMALAYDPVRDETIMFGGYDSYEGYLGDTWVLRGNRWRELQPSTAPSRRVGAAMAFDPHLQQIVLFGGCCPAKGDTWTWDGTTWELLHPAAAPADRGAAALAYDPHRDALLLFGGENGEPYRDTWRWDGSTWVEETMRRAPGAMFRPDAATFGRHLMLYGGTKRSTWVLGRESWRRLQTDQTPYDRPWVSLEWDPVRRNAVLYGSRGNDTWTVRPVRQENVS